MTQDRTVELNIYGVSYSISTSESEEYAKRVIQYVDEKMKEVSAKSVGRSDLQIAVFAALNIADELFQEKKKKSQTPNPTEGRLIRLSEMLSKEIDNQ